MGVAPPRMDIEKVAISDFIQLHTRFCDRTAMILNARQALEGDIGAGITVTYIVRVYKLHSAKRVNLLPFARIGP